MGNPKPLIPVGILLVGLALAAGCGEGSQGASSGVETSTAVATESGPTETTTTEVATMSRPIRCLDAAGLSQVGERKAGVWIGNHAAPTFAIVVHKLAVPATAPRVVAGEYALTGSFKIVAVGRGLIGDEGIEADALVQTVADCLGG